MTSELSAAYDEWHGRFDVEAEASSPWHVLVKRYLVGLPRATVLEVGCGRGELADWLGGQGPDLVVAADFSPAAVTKAAHHCKQPLFGFEVADIQRLPHANSSFDIVISCETIEHVATPRMAVAELARVLKPAGRLYLTTPNYLGTMGVFRAYRRIVGRPFTEEGQPINNFTFLPRTLCWLRAAGLIPQLADASGHYMPVPRRRPIRVPLLDGPHPLVKWFGLHQLIIASKPSPR